MTDPPVIEVITEPKGGHASVSFTLDRYGHLYVERLSGPLGWRDGASTCGSVWWA
jgi:hypothetical protein